jgi:hypothetical protein
VVLGQVVDGEAAPVGLGEQVQPLVVDLGGGAPRRGVDPVEEAELDLRWSCWCCGHGRASPSR